MSELTYESAFPGRFTKAALFEGKRVTLTITRAYMEKLEGDKGVEDKLVFSFKETPKELVCNKTNALCMKEMFGNKISAWVGKRITFHPTTTQFGPKTVDCIRIYGSPDIAADIPVAARIGRKNFKATLVAVPKTAGATAKSVAAPTTTVVPSQAEVSARESAGILGWTDTELAAELAADSGDWTVLNVRMGALVDEQLARQ